MSGNHYEDTPGMARRGQPLTTWQDFEGGLRQREQEIAAMLPAHVSRARFHAVALAAVKQTPELLQCTPRSLFSSVTKAAQDGLLPDGREGVITVYNTKQKNGSYQKVAQWNPMAHGLRKRAKEIDGIQIDAQVVHANDTFKRLQGDDPKIIHEPAQLGTPRGQMVGAYAIFKREDGTVLHREVMEAAQIEKVRAQSKAPDSLMWSKFPEEGWRKTVLRRGIKSVPVSEKLETIVRRDDDAFSFDQPLSAPSENAPPRPQMETRRAQDRSVTPQDGVIIDESEDDDGEEEQPPADTVQGKQEPAKPADPAKTAAPAELTRKSEPKAAAAEAAAAAQGISGAGLEVKASAPLPGDDEGEGEKPPSKAFTDATGMVEKFRQQLESDESVEINEFKGHCRTAIDNFEGITDDERDVLRGRFSSYLLTAQKKQQGKGKKRT